jgi:hypothetical protein
LALAKKPRADRRTISTAWLRLAGEQAVIADIATQGAAAVRRHDAKALDATFDRLRVAILDATKLHNTNREYLDEEVQS